MKKFIVIILSILCLLTPFFSRVSNGAAESYITFTMLNTHANSDDSQNDNKSDDFKDENQSEEENDDKDDESDKSKVSQHHAVFHFFIQPDVKPGSQVLTINPNFLEVNSPPPKA